jgi:phage terminase small subunit
VTVLVWRIPRAPRWLPPAGRRFWRLVVPELVRLGVLHPVLDGPLVELAAVNYAVWQRAVEEWQDATDPARRDQLHQVADAQAAVWLQVAREFGLSPAGRRDLRRMMEAGVDPSAQFVAHLRGAGGR